MLMIVTLHSFILQIITVPIGTGDNAIILILTLSYL